MDEFCLSGKPWLKLGIEISFHGPDPSMVSPDGRRQRSLGSWFVASGISNLEP